MSFSAQLLRGVRVTLILWLLTVVVVTLPMLALARLVRAHHARGQDDPDDLRHPLPGRHRHERQG